MFFGAGCDFRSGRSQVHLVPLDTLQRLPRTSQLSVVPPLQEKGSENGLVGLRGKELLWCQRT